MPATTGWGHGTCKEAHQQSACCVSLGLAGGRYIIQREADAALLSSMGAHTGRQHAQQASLSAQRAHQTASWRPSTATASGLVRSK